MITVRDYILEMIMIMSAGYLVNLTVRSEIQVKTLSGCVLYQFNDNYDADHIYSVLCHYPSKISVQKTLEKQEKSDKKTPAKKKLVPSTPQTLNTPVVPQVINQVHLLEFKYIFTI